MGLMARLPAAQPRAAMTSTGLCGLAGGSVHHGWEGDRATVRVLVHGTKAELHVVLGNVERDRRDVADGDSGRPVRIRGLPHHNLVAVQVGFGVGVPGECTEVGAWKA